MTSVFRVVMTVLTVLVFVVLINADDDAATVVFIKARRKVRKNVIMEDVVVVV